MLDRTFGGVVSHGHWQLKSWNALGGILAYVEYILPLSQPKMLLFNSTNRWDSAFMGQNTKLFPIEVYFMMSI
jgi:hypothetical protein